MKKYTKISVQWFYSLLERGECDIVDFKEQLEDKKMFGKSLKNFAPKYDEMARDVVAFSNLKGGFLFLGIADETKEVNETFVYDDKKIFELIKQVQDRTTPTITLIPHRIRVNGTDLLVNKRLIIIYYYSIIGDINMNNKSKQLFIATSDEETATRLRDLGY